MSEGQGWLFSRLDVAWSSTLDGSTERRPRWAPAAALHVTVRAYKSRLDVKAKFQSVIIFADKSEFSTSEHRKTKHLSIEPTNGRHRARRASRLTANEAFWDIQGGAPGADRIGSERVVGGAGRVTSLPGAHTCSNIFFSEARSSYQASCSMMRIGDIKHENKFSSSCFPLFFRTNLLSLLPGTCHTCVLHTTDWHHFFCCYCSTSSIYCCLCTGCAAVLVLYVLVVVPLY